MQCSNHSPSQNINIVTVDSPQANVLTNKTKDMNENELALMREIFNQLFTALSPHFPAAGLAAPQIGIDKAIFIYSYDRDPQHLEAIINPTLTPEGDEIVEGWEGCLSVILSNGVWKLARVPRYEKIMVSYINLNGERVVKLLEGFAAKVFQHEYDHLQGVVNINRENATIKEFQSKEEMLDFMQNVKKEDALRYNNSK